MLDVKFIIYICQDFSIVDFVLAIKFHLHQYVIFFFLLDDIIISFLISLDIQMKDQWPGNSITAN